MVGYLIRDLVFTPPTSPGAAFLAARAGLIGYAGQAVDAEDATDVYGALYGALATGWVEAGCLSHYVQVAPTDALTEERWHALGFGRESVTAIRDTEGLGPADWPGDIRLAGQEDLDTIVRFIEGLHRFLTAAPMWRPYLPETVPEERAVQKQMLEDPACAHWIASEAGQPLAMQSFQPPPWYLSRMIVPDRSVYLVHAYTAPAARGKRIGTTLLASAMAWAREAGFRRCLVDFTAANRVSARFWLGHGFRPIVYRLCHRLDERLASARPDDHGA
jgi:GNAT superfamily N-acetyltransferase